jgi:Flp pilus assembly protein TadG
MSAGGLRHDDGGATAVEFALVVPVLMLLLVGAFDLSRAVNAYVTVSNASREGARYAVLHPTASPDDIAAAVDSRSVPLDPSVLAVDAEYYDGSDFESWPDTGIPANTPPANISIRITVSYPWSSATALIGGFIGGGSRTLQSTSVMEMVR